MVDLVRSNYHRMPCGREAQVEEVTHRLLLWEVIIVLNSKLESSRTLDWTVRGH